MVVIIVVIILKQFIGGISVKRVNNGSRMRENNAFVNGLNAVFHHIFLNFFVFLYKTIKSKNLIRNLSK
ncbi:hypothetical protein BHC25_02150 [Mannheimia haemolytica]|nr:hypothetical protein BHC25_02150 [Mannheimia haemolytica]